MSENKENVNENCFTEDDIAEALKISGTAMWKLISDGKSTPRFYGDKLMNQLIGVSDDTLPVDRFNYFMSRIFPDDMKLFLEYYDALKNTSKAEVVYRYNHPEKGVIYVRCGGMKSSQNGDDICYRGFHQDVTDTIRVEQETRQRLTERAEMFRTIAFKLMENYSDAAAKIDLESGYFEWYKFDGDNVLNHPDYKDIFEGVCANVPVEYRDEYRNNASLENLRDRLQKSDTFSFSTFVRQTKDGDLRRVFYWYFKPHPDSNYAFSVFKDTTEEYEKERQLADALLMSQQANKAKTLFLNNMSHDIRTPMNAIIGFTELVEKNLDDREKILDYLDKIKLSSKHLLSLINDVLDMSRIESGRMAIKEEPCSIIEIIDNLATIFQSDATKKGLEFITDTSSVRDKNVLADKLRLNQVLLNCSSNSIKFTKPGGRVIITASQNDSRLIPEGYGEYQFMVEDTGIGMSEEYLEKIFEPFSREENTVHQIEGTGLGMAICKKIVDLMNGSIEVKSKKGVGTIFTITLRLKLTDESKVSEEETETDISSLQGKRILLAEDNELNREIALEILGDTGAVVEVAVDGKEAVDMFEASPIGYYDLILMDIKMPIMNGYEATMAIRKIERKDASTIKILAMTANAFEEDKRQALLAGMDGHLAKPIDIKIVMKKLCELLR